MSTRHLLRSVAYQSGALSLARRRQRGTLTVLMLHRVLDQSDPDYASADPAWTLPLSLFEQFLDFLVAHYHVVSLADVIAAQDGVRPLPAHALLITFDDGWADNLRYAAPALSRKGLPAVVFAVPAAIAAAGECWWQELVFAASRFDMLDVWLMRRDVQRALAGLGERPHGLDVVCRLADMDQAARDGLMTGFPARSYHARMMLEPDELEQLPRYGIAVGLHGYSHVPLTRVRDVAAELRDAREAVKALSGGTATISALGCPHGQYDDHVVAAAHAQGIKHVFTSDPYLNITRDGMLDRTRTIGRINVVGRQIERAPGELDPAGAARWLWARDVR
ncbi:MAG TPA: polysaccharide deacetylase family protein [Acetobacteraceae bacterium]|nr:polysaccharide deacetylase family protein [Acetobacteraceae bacterium]